MGHNAHKVSSVYPCRNRQAHHRFRKEVPKQQKSFVAHWFTKSKAFLADEYLHDIQTHCDQRYFYFRAKCFHSFKVHDEPHNLKLAVCIVSGAVEHAYCGPSCAAGKSGFCNHILALMLKVCKYSLYDCKDVWGLKDEDENPTTACTSSLQNWHKSRMEGIRAQRVMEAVVTNPVNNIDKGKMTGIPSVRNFVPIILSTFYL